MFSVASVVLSVVLVYFLNNRKLDWDQVFVFFLAAYGILDIYFDILFTVDIRKDLRMETETTVAIVFLVLPTLFNLAFVWKILHKFKLPESNNTNPYLAAIIILISIIDISAIEIATIVPKLMIIDENRSAETILLAKACKAV